jgi:hypothetical protein
MSWLPKSPKARRSRRGAPRIRRGLVAGGLIGYIARR